MSLANVIAQRLRAAGIAPNDPGLIFTREWNQLAIARAAEAERIRWAKEQARWRAELEQRKQGRAGV